MPSVGVIQQRMNSHAVKKDGRAPAFSEVDVQSSNCSRTIVESSICDAYVRCDRQSRVMLQVLAQRRIKRLSRRCADAIGTCAEDERRSPVSFSDGEKIRDRADFPRERIVFNACCEPRVEPVGERVAPLRTIDLIRDHAHAVRPFEITYTCPAHGAAFSRSKRSAWYG